MVTAEEVQLRRRQEFGRLVQEWQDAIVPRVSDRELARRIGISATHLATIKRGGVTLRPQMADKIAAAFLKPPSLVYAAAGLPTEDYPSAGLQLARRLEPLLSSLSVERRAAVETALERVVEVMVSAAPAA